MRIGIITAMEQETKSINENLGNVIDESTINGVRIMQIDVNDNTVFLATSGVGELCAAMTVQLLQDLFDVEVILNFGYVGSLSPKIGKGEIVIADRVCHYQFDTSALDGTKVGQYFKDEDQYLYLDEELKNTVLSALGKSIRRVTVASGDKFVCDGDEKKKLYEELGCDICDMELAGLALACRRNGLPLVSIKVVSDNADEAAVENFENAINQNTSQYEGLMPIVIAAVVGDVAPLPPVNV